MGCGTSLTHHHYKLVESYVVSVLALLNHQYPTPLDLIPPDLCVQEVDNSASSDETLNWTLSKLVYPIYLTLLRRSSGLNEGERDDVDVFKLTDYHHTVVRVHRRRGARKST